MGTDDWQLWGLQREPGPRVGTRPTGQHTHSLLWLTAPRGLKAVIPGVQWGGGHLSIWLSGKRRQIWAQSHIVTLGGCRRLNGQHR